MLKDVSPSLTEYHRRVPLFSLQLTISNDQISTIQATAIQYLHRFYLSQSTMVHHPLLIMKCCLFFALKTDNYYLELDKFLSFLPGTTRSDILDQEYLLLRTLRYTMDVRHPFRGLEGGVMELMGWASGEGEAPPGSAKSPAELRRDLLAIEAVDGGGGKTRDMSTRIGIAATKAKNLLKSAAVLTDAYFLFTPSQIWLAALLLSDAPLFRFYLRSKFPSPPSQHSFPTADDIASSSSSHRLYAKVIRTIESCASLLQTYSPVSETDVKTSLKSIGKKLHYIEKLWEKYPKHGTKREQDEEVERERKKRKLEREKGEREGDVFGGPIGGKAAESNGGGGGGGEWSD
jgi:cyclin H